MYGESDIYPELVYSVAAEQIREQQWEEQQRRAHRPAGEARGAAPRGVAARRA